MSQRSALTAAAIATAEVSEPPRPSVVMRPVCGLMPWKPAMTATSLRSLKRLMISLPSMSRMRAEAWASLVLIGICQPCQERAWMPMPCSTMASRPEVTCSPEATTASYSRASCTGEASVHQATSSLVLPDIAETTTATSWPASTSRFTWRATLRIRSILATDVPPNFITRRLMTTRAFPHKDKYGDPRGQRPRIPNARIQTVAAGGKRVPAGPDRAGNGLIEVMSRYIDEILQPGEKVLYSTNAHWIFYSPAIVAWIAALVLFVLSRQTSIEWVTLLGLAGAALVALAA